jgi:predicted secreted protein
LITWAEAHIRAGALAAGTRADLGIALDRPVDVFSVIEQLGLVLAFAPLGRVSGLYIPDGRSAGILIHEGHPRTRQRYTAGHELGHHVFGHSTEIDSDLEGALQREYIERWPDHEKEAEAYGAWLLMPRQLLRVGLRELDISEIKTPLDIYSLSLWLGTSYTATVRQLATTRILDQSRAESWRRIPPRSLKRQLVGEFVPNDLRNDVWWLDARHARLPVEARPGDRLVITLDEVPSSGYSWEITDMGATSIIADSYDANWEPHLPDSKFYDHEELVGGSYPRSFLLEVRETAERSVSRIVIANRRSWEAAAPAEQVELTVSVNGPLHGVQLREQELTLSA